VKVTTTGLALVFVGDAALLIGALGLAGVFQLSNTAGAASILVGIGLNVAGFLAMIRAARTPNG
jgi:hypothetical protein